MCGIFWELCQTITVESAIEKDGKLLHCINCRGPNHSSHSKYSHRHSPFVSHAFCSVLWMQGHKMTKQPLETKDQILLYNGDNFDWNSKCPESDTQKLFDTIYKKEKDIVTAIQCLKGPFSIIYLDKNEDKIYFSRDQLGRNSLLFCRTKKGFILSSVLSRDYKHAIEVPTSHIFEIDLRTNTVVCYPWVNNKDEIDLDMITWFNNIYNLQDQPDEIKMPTSENCVINIDKEAQKLIDFIETTCRNSQTKEEILENLQVNSIISGIVDQLVLLLKRSIEIRLKKHPQKCKNCVKLNKDCRSHCCVSVLFSGGLDCTILALLADDYVPKDQPIDLLNVAFQMNQNNSFDVPDRLTARLAFQELKELRPDREWQLMEINVGAKELEEQQKTTIADLVYPRKTILDESLGSALWFAARGTANGVESTSRVVLVGSGADELFGGYTRHRNALKRRSWQGLHDELLLDWHRLPHRNLARDNRVICHSGRQPRLPYLDEDFVEFVNGLKPWERCFPSVECPSGLGEKLYLRLAACKIGLKKRVALFPKRAIQFGSRIANKKENGADVSVRFLNKTAG